MSRYVQFWDKSTGEEASLQAVDQAICEHFGVREDPKKFYKEWMSGVGLLLAIGLRDDDLRSQLRAGFHSMPDRLYELTEILEFIEDHYQVESWTEAGNVSS